MLRLAISHAILLALIMACSSGDHAGISDTNIAFELMKMQEQGAIDSLIMDRALSSFMYSTKFFESVTLIPTGVDL